MKKTITVGLCVLLVFVIFSSGCLDFGGGEQKEESQNPTWVSGGLKGKYYDSMDFTNFKFTQVDSTINFNWGSGMPTGLTDGNYFSIVWEGRIKIDSDGDYTFYTKTDDGDRLWIDGDLIIDEWSDEVWGQSHSKTIYLSAGFHTITMNYYEKEGNAYVELSWSSSSFTKQIIPSSHLYYFSS
ncbi:MAG: PA14 domain-containing protein [Candidatus Methanoperedenaceae archaeon]|nr:PA14 domain-containing protein [Candidatus Methanoperedenaceae archaeon]